MKIKNKLMIIVILTIIAIGFVGCPETDRNGDISATFTGLTANGSSTETTTKLTLTFDRDIDGLEAVDITLSGSTGATKGALNRTGTGVYELTVTGITSSGQLTVTVSKSGYVSGSLSVNVYYYVTPEPTQVAFSNLTADGSSTETTTKLTLTFDKDIANFAATDITLSGSTGATKGALSRTGTGVYELTVTGITTNGQVGVAVSKSGFAFTPTNQSVEVFYYVAPIEVAFSELTADGSVTETTTKLTLIFDKDIANFAATDITLSGSTGATKGSLTKQDGTGMYELTISGITTSGEVEVTVSKSGFNFTPTSQSVDVIAIFSSNIFINFISPSQDLGEIAQQEESGSLTFSVDNAGHYSAFQWLLNGDEMSETASSITLDVSALAKGPHRLVVIADAIYSQEITFRIN